ncbi:MAG: LPD29 domain-containing protein [Spirulina sp.]
MSAAEVAQNIRPKLKAQFPGIKFSVRSQTYSGGSSIRIAWVDGPCGDAVKAITQEFESIRRDAATGEILAGGNRYIFLERDYSESTFRQVLEATCAKWGVDVPPISTSCGKPYLADTDDVERVGGGLDRLSELTRMALAVTDLREPEPAPEQLEGDMESFQNFIKATREPKAQRAEDANGKLIGGQFEYNGLWFTVQPVNSSASYRTIGYRLIIDGKGYNPLRHVGRRPNRYFESLTEARRAAFWYLSGANPLTLRAEVLEQIFRTTAQVVWLVESAGYAGAHDQVTDWVNRRGWNHTEVVAEAVVLLHDCAKGEHHLASSPANPKASKAQTERLTKRATSFRAMADKMQAQIDHKLADRLTNTRKRAEEAAAMRRSGYHLQHIQAILRAIADQCDTGSLTGRLDVITSKADIEQVIGLAEYFEMTEAESQHHPAMTDYGWGTDHVIRTYGITQENLEQDHYADLRCRFSLSADQLADLLRQLKTITMNGVVIDYEKERLNRLLTHVGNRKIQGYFPTPPPLAERMASLLDVGDDDIVLDPQGGGGALLQAVREQQARATLRTLEINYDLREILKLREFEVVGSDSMKYCPADEDRATRIIMNPPFEGQGDISHIRYAYDSLLAPGGRLVAILSSATFFRTDRMSQAFREWLDSEPNVLVKEQNEPDAFKASGTMAQTWLLAVDKPAQAQSVPSPTHSPRLGQLTLALF